MSDTRAAIGTRAGGTDRSPLAHRPALDGVRAIAVAGVLLFHASVTAGGHHLDGGFLGVDLFFALSGYLITTLLLREHEATGHIRLGAFWARRARRLLPALVLVVGTTLVALQLLYGADAVAANRDEAIAGLFSVQNWYTLHASPPFLTVFQHLWSLSIEAQFYVVWPLVAILVLGRAPRGPAVAPDVQAARRGAARLFGVALVGAAASSALMAALHTGPDSLARVYFGTDTRATPILLGAAFACATARWGEIPTGRSRTALDAAGWIALVAVIGTWAVVNRPSDALYEGGFVLYSVAAVVLVAAAAHPQPRSFNRALAVAPLRALGLISYGVYLWHWPVFYLANAERLHLQGWVLLGVQVAITLALATASYHAIEVPIRARRWPFTRAPHSGPAPTPRSNR